ncbi:DUF3872 domain-containing protein [Flavobacterium sp. HSC-32F16]|uniref:DUF3872 domain-containing protein n=1 Tax=Flavobacterium sp. HSC-32F16 TaxID=2910964 RepID=UPI0020A2A5EA|nr:DUF3872 domain-containing protein [Flavobacterium sp. HSC-32F16]
MTAFFNKLRARLLPVAVMISSFTLLSCSGDELQIQNNFPFEVKVMPVPTAISNGDRVEIRITIQQNGHYTGTQYFIRYFQSEGKGTLRYYDEPKYLPNDLYQMPAQQFRLYYTSQSTVSQSFDVWISDNFGNEKQLIFQFNNSD